MHGEMRKLSVFERKILNSLLSADIPCTSILRQQIDDCRVKTIDEYGSIKIVTNSNTRCTDADGAPITGQADDIDTIPGVGPYINFVIFVRDGVIYELQIYKDDGTPIKVKMDDPTLTLTWGTPPRKIPLQG